jgi:hypothetical protein
MVTTFPEKSGSALKHWEKIEERLFTEKIKQ